LVALIARVPSMPSAYTINNRRWLIRVQLAASLQSKRPPPLLIIMRSGIARLASKY
jgi:hypothetical protein